MTYKIPATRMVPQLDDEGYFTGYSVADESPMVAGQWDLAHNAIDAKAPPREALEHEAIRWTGADWSYQPDYTGATLYDTRTGEQIDSASIKRGQSLCDLFATLLQPQHRQQWDSKKKRWVWSIQQIRERKLAELAATRWDVQCAGVTGTGQSGGVVFASSPDDKARLQQTIEDCEMMGDDVVTFKAKSGFVELTVDQLKAGYKAIVAHTQLCYKNERVLTEQINALVKAEDVQEFNLLGGWPV